MNTLFNFGVRAFIRVFLPGIAESMKEEGRFDFRNAAAGSAGAGIPSYMDVEDNGADTTIICFAGMAVLYAAMPKFEFRKTLMQGGMSCNFIWVRDVHRSSYYLTPTGTPGGYEFYARSIHDALIALKSSRVIAIGASGGGAAAFALSGITPIDLIIAFNPAFPLKDYGSASSRLKALLDVKKLLCAPRDYFEVLLIALSSNYLWKKDCRLLGEENLPDVTEYYLKKQPPARAVVLYSQDCRPDRELALRLKNIPEVVLTPVPSGRHNCMAELKKRSELGPLIQEQIRKYLPVEPGA